MENNSFSQLLLFAFLFFRFYWIMFLAYFERDDDNKM